MTKALHQSGKYLVTALFDPVKPRPLTDVIQVLHQPKVLVLQNRKKLPLNTYLIDEGLFL